MTYTEKDLERAHATLFGPGLYEQRIAQLIADVRRETMEECINACRPVAAVTKHEGGLYVAMERIRALLDEPEVTNVERKCRVCGGLEGFHWMRANLDHDFAAPEDPDHG